MKILFNSKETKKELRRLRNVSNKATDAGLKRALKPTKKILEDATPVERAILKKGVGLKNLTQKEKTKHGINKKDRAVKVGFVRKTKDAKLRRLEKKITLPALASILSYGSKAHEIFPKNKKALRFGGNYTKSVKHPGTKGTGFIQRAFGKMESGSLDLFYKGIDEYMVKHGY